MDYKKLAVKKVTAAPPQELITAILKSRKPDYLPKQVSLRASIDRYIKTVELKSADVETVRKDPDIVSLEIAVPMPPTKPGKTR